MTFAEDTGGLVLSGHLDVVPFADQPGWTRDPLRLTFEGDRVYVHFGADGTAALTTGGDVVWTAQFPYESQHGNGGSPVVNAKNVYICIDGTDRREVVAFDKETGKVAWEATRRQPPQPTDKPFSFCTPLLIEVGGKPMVVAPGSGVAVVCSCGIPFTRT